MEILTKTKGVFENLVKNLGPQYACGTYECKGIVLGKKNIFTMLRASFTLSLMKCLTNINGGPQYACGPRLLFSQNEIFYELKYLKFVFMARGIIQ